MRGTRARPSVGALGAYGLGRAGTGAPSADPNGSAPNLSDLLNLGWPLPIHVTARANIDTHQLGYGADGAVFLGVSQ